MPVRVLASPAFVRAVRDRLLWLAEHRDEDQIESFLTALETVRNRIERHPEAGTIVRQDAQHIVRRRLFPRPLPYLVYYAYERGGTARDVHLVGLYASGQDREDIEMSEWPW